MPAWAVQRTARLCMQMQQCRQICPPTGFAVYIATGSANSKNPVNPNKGVNMKRLSLFIAMAVALPSVWAQVKPCEELKAEIAAKIEANGVKNYTLEIVDNDKVGDGKVVGTCEGGTKKIVYTRK
jgi:hypothetical protein